MKLILDFMISNIPNFLTYFLYRLLFHSSYFNLTQPGQR